MNVEILICMVQKPLFFGLPVQMSNSSSRIFWPLIILLDLQIYLLSNIPTVGGLQIRDASVEKRLIDLAPGRRLGSTL